MKPANIRRLIYGIIFLACVLPIAWPSNWGLIWPKGWWKVTWKLPFERSDKIETGIPELEIGNSVLHISESGVMTLGEIVEIQKQGTLIFVHLKTEKGVEEISPYSGTWIYADNFTEEGLRTLLKKTNK